MNRNRRLLLAVTVVVALLSAAFALTWLSQATTVHGDEPEGGVIAAQGEPAAVSAPVPGGPGFYMRGAPSFMPRFSGYDWTYSQQELRNTGGSPAYWDAPLALPHGATMTKFVLYFNDSNASQNLYAALYRCTLDSGTCDPSAFATSSGAPGYGFAEDGTISFPVIDNQSYVYVAEANLPNADTVGLIGVRIDYEFSAKLPLVTKDH
jgi:hypothetical protein